MLTIIKNDWNRLMQQKLHLFVAIGLTICSVIFAILLTDKMKPKLNIAVVGTEEKISAPKQMNLIYLKEQPKQSAMIQKQYDACAVAESNGNYKVTSQRGKAFDRQVAAVLCGQIKGMTEQKAERRIGTNIIGFLFMYLLMQGMLYARFFAEDKEKHQIERVVCSPISFRTYLTGHGTFMWMLICIPSFLVVAIADLIGVNVGFALWQYIILIGIIGTLAVSIGLCINSFFCVADTANMTGTSVIVLSSVLAGSFYDRSNSHDILAKILYVLPQKGFMYFANTWEKHTVHFTSLLAIFYVIIVSVLLLFIGVTKTRKQYIYHRS